MKKKANKVGILTFHRANNYGAVLQAYALQTYLETIGVNAEIVDYRSAYLEKAYRGHSLANKDIKKLLRDLSDWPIRYLKNKAFEKYRKQYLNLSKTYLENNVIESNNMYDYFVFGSDQIWNYNLSGKDSNYLGAFVSDKKKLNSYAASFGTYRTREKEYLEMLKRFNKVSVREESGRKFFNEITNRTDTKLVMDPVFLINENKWKSLVNEKKVKRYIFLYTLQGEKTKMKEVAQYLADRTGLKIVEMQAWLRPKPKNFIPRYCDTPIDFLSWISGADYVITDSFHCTAFSIIFKKKFWVKIAECSEISDSRVGNLLHLLHLEERVIGKNLGKWDIDAMPKYEEALDKLKKEINFSKEFVNTIIKGEKIK